MTNENDDMHLAFSFLSRDIEQYFVEKNINAKVYFDKGMITEDIVSSIEEGNHALHLVINTEHNQTPVETASTSPLPYYDSLRSRLNDLATEKKIIVLSGVMNSNLDGIPTPNIHYIWLHYSAMLYELNSYLDCDIVRIKNFNSTKHWISLNRCHNHHRLMMAMVLLGYNLGLCLDETKNTGRLHISPSPLENTRTWRDFWNNGGSTIDVSTHKDQILQRGFKRLKNGMNGGQPDGKVISGSNPITFSSKNFDQRLRYLYQDSVIEIVNGTTYYNPAGYNYCEKALNPILGLNLPLFACNVGTVEGMRLMGFDMFDDILDHSYDTIQDPIERMFVLVESNLGLLQNRDLARACWVKALPRMLENVKVAREMLPRATKKVLQDLDQYVEKNF